MENLPLYFKSLHDMPPKPYKHKLSVQLQIYTIGPSSTSSFKTFVAKLQMLAKILDKTNILFWIRLTTFFLQEIISVRIKDWTAHLIQSDPKSTIKAVNSLPYNPDFL